MATSHDKSTRWLVFGDSIVSGFFDTCGGWVDRLKHDQMMKFIRDGAGVKVFDLGISGQTSKDLLARIEGEVALSIIAVMAAAWFRPRWKSPSLNTCRSLTQAIVLSPSHWFSPSVKF